MKIKKKQSTNGTFKTSGTPLKMTKRTNQGHRRRRGSGLWHGRHIHESINKIFPNLEKEMVIQVKEAFRTPNRQEKNRASSCHITAKILSIQSMERLFNAAREKNHVTYKGKLIKITDFKTIPKHLLPISNLT
jgi:hypothetical protein